MEPNIIVTKTASVEGVRLDVAFSDEQYSRSRLANLIEKGHLTVNGTVQKKPSFRVHEGDCLVLTLPPVKTTNNQAQDLPLEILYEDQYLAVVVKPEGMVVHPAPGNEEGTLVNALLHHLTDLSGIGGEERPGIVHRLDKDTSGVMLVAKDDQTHLSLSKQLSNREIEKHYRAKVYGLMKEMEGEIEQPIMRSQKDRKKMAVNKEGRYALTKWKVLTTQGNNTLLDVRIITGRTHQIRVHMAYIHHPVMGDVIYGPNGGKGAPRLMLHAYSLAFTHPITKQKMTFTAPCPFYDEQVDE